MPKELFLACIFITFFVNAVSAQDVIDEFPKGSINWSKGTVSAVGSGVVPPGTENSAQGRLLAERAAISEARRNLLEIVGEVRVDAVSSVSTLMAKSDVIITRVGGIVKGSVVTQRRYLDDGSAEVTVEMPITGAFIDVILSEVRNVPSITMSVPKTKKKVALEIESKVSPSAEKKKLPEPARPEARTEPVRETKAAEAEKIDLTKVYYSGLIIDAREVDVKPALLPKVLDEKGDVIYSSANMQKDDAVKTGVVGYAKEVDAARKHPRVTETPIVIAALKGSGEKRSDVVISDRDAQTITVTEPAQGYLNKGRVMIVYK